MFRNVEQRKLGQTRSGIEYISTMSPDGVNLAVFDNSLLKCTSTTVYDVKALNYSYDKVK
ncbi:hypothetical protein [Desulfosporosinus hippei]|uniref:Uncharacterized protein n=1 Tax=Desulfosporosinus hippei DSM 8344 TaxID=1121419 RepID=A0A1G8D4G0_9FIRM|nr:hypothetical protein [Desulfosporosinus hippei]SDH52636.1 hypothetical protein SAMN05443529_114109 [Desulfosporosinus hippei DSM 8344]